MPPADPDHPPAFSRRTVRRLLVAVTVVMLVAGLTAGVVGRHRFRAALDRYRANTLAEQCQPLGRGGPDLSDAEFDAALHLAVHAADPVARYSALMAAAHQNDQPPPGQTGPWVFVPDAGRLDRVEPVALGWLDSPDPRIQGWGVTVLVFTKRPAHLDRIRALAGSPDPEVRRLVGMAVTQLGQQVTLPLLAALSDRRPLLPAELDRVTDLCGCGDEAVEEQAVMVLAKACRLQPALRPRLLPLFARLAADPARPARQREAADAHARLEAADVPR